MRSRLFAAILLSVILILALPTWAQEITANIVGTVKDQTGAVIAGATVTITNTDKGIVIRTLKSDDSGNFTAPLLPIGTYAVTAEAPGFKKLTQKNIVLNVNDKRTVVMELPVGASGTTVEVEANPVAVDLQSATTAGLITGNQIRELTLNNRVYLQLVTLMPGVSDTGLDQYYIGVTNPLGGTNVLGIAVNGQRTSANNWTLDGADNVDRGSNLTLMMMPSVDSIAEFKVLRSNYDAEFGRSGAAQINVITRSGTSSFHGSAFEYWRNENLQADTYFNKQNARYFSVSQKCADEFNGGNRALPAPNCDTRQPYRYHNFGWNIGGPAYIPGVYNKNKDKTFFFFSQEYRRVITYSPLYSAVMPTSDMLNGKFPIPVCTALNSSGVCTSTTTQITGISPLASAYIKDIWSKMPLATDPNPLNDSMFFSSPSQANYTENLLKIDHVFGPRLSVYGRYIHDAIPTTEPFGIFGPNSYLPNVGNTATNSPGWSLVGRFTATLDPKTIVDGGYNFSYGAILSDPTGLMNMKNSPDIKANLPFPTTLNAVPGIGYSYYAGLGTHPHYEDYNRNHQALINFTKIFGKHSLKAGFTYYHYQKTENAAGSNSGSFVFRYYGTAPCNTFSGTGACTGYTDPAGTLWSPTKMNYLQNWANFLLGKAYSFSQASLDMYPDIRDNQFEWYARDEFRMTPRITLNYGMHFSMFRQPTDASGMLTNFDPKFYNPANAPTIDPTTGYMVAPTTAQLLNGIAPTAAALANCQKLLSSGQVPLCWPSGTTAPYGSKIGNEYNNAFGPRIGIAWDPWGDGKTSVRSGFGMFYDTGLFGVVEQNIFQNPPFVQSLALTGNTTGTSIINFDNPVGSLAISTVPKRVYSRVDPNYHTPYTMNWNFGVQRQVTASTLLDVSYVGNRSNHQLGIEDLNQPPVGAYLQYPTNLCGTGGCLATGMTSATKLNYIRPYKGFGAIDAIRTQFMSNYHSLQVSLNKRFKGASQIGVAYTWSHALTDNQTDRSTAPRDTYNPQLDYGPTQQDRRHVFNANFVYELPWYKGQQGVVGHLLGGWEVTGILIIQTGTPFTIYDNTGNRDMAGQGCIGATPCYVFTDQVSDNLYGFSGPQRIFGPTAPTTKWWWFNTSAFAQVPTGDISDVRVGNSRRGAIYGPGMWRQDLSIMKNMKFTERFTGQLRADAFNVFNHTNPSSINTTNTSTYFGQVTGTRDPRIMQVGMKVNF